MNASAGVAQFSGLTLDKQGNGYTLVATSGNLSSATSDAFSVIFGTPSQLVFTTQPPAATIQANVAFPGSIQVGIRDAFGNTVPVGVATLSLGVKPWPNAALIGGLTAGASSSGVLSWSGLRIDKPGTYTVRATMGSITAESVPFKVGLTFSSIEAGGFHACGLTGGGTYCWGRGTSGQMGRLSSTSDSVPGVVGISGLPAGGLSLLQLSVGGNHACGVVISNIVYCWGSNTFGQIGDATSGTDRNFPTITKGSGTSPLAFTSVSAGDTHTCGVTTDAAVYCWGHNNSGQLGDGTPTDRPAPVLVTGSGTAPLTFTGVSAGANHTCGVTSGNRVYCWGLNDQGMLGNGSSSPSMTPVQVSGSGSGALLFAQVSAGSQHTCALTTSSAVYCWGLNTEGRLGTGNTSPSQAPVLVMGSGTTLNFTSVSAGVDHTCAATASTLYCWGAAAYGQVGDGGNSPRSSPVAIGPGTEINAGSAFTCGRSGQKVQCWGFNSDGQLGIGALVPAFSVMPVDVVQ